MTVKYPLAVVSLFVSLFVALLVAVTLPARADEKPMPMPMMRGEQMAADLNLSAEQQKAREHAMELHRECMKAEQAFHDQVRDMVHSDQYDEKKLKELIGQYHKDAEINILASAKAMHEFHASLSPEQKEKLSKMRDGMKEGMKEHMKDRMKERRTERKSGKPDAEPPHHE